MWKVLQLKMGSNTPQQQIKRIITRNSIIGEGNSLQFFKNSVISSNFKAPISFVLAAILINLLHSVIRPVSAQKISYSVIMNTMTYGLFKASK